MSTVRETGELDGRVKRSTGRHPTAPPARGPRRTTAAGDQPTNQLCPSPIAHVAGARRARRARRSSPNARTMSVALAGGVAAASCVCSCDASRRIFRGANTIRPERGLIPLPTGVAEHQGSLLKPAKAPSEAFDGNGRVEPGCILALHQW